LQKQFLKPLLLEYCKNNGNIYIKNLKKEHLMHKNLVLPQLKSLFFALPKAELHVHLAGAYPVYKIREFFREKGISEKDIAKVTSVQDLYDDLTDFVNHYMVVASLVKTEEQIERAAYAICIKAAEDNVRYIELKIASSELDPEKTQDKQKRLEQKEKMFFAVKKGVNNAKKNLLNQGFKQTVKFMYTAERHEPPEISLEDAQLAVKWSKNPDNNFVGFDLAGDEVNFSIERHKDAIDYARENGLLITCHAGETANSEQYSDVLSMKRAIELGAKRIGHGLAACKDQSLIDLIKQEDITIEVSPTSNISTMSIKDWTLHPIKNMIENNIKVALCSDDPAMFNTKITREYMSLYKYGLLTKWVDIKKIVMNGVNASFLPEAEKAVVADEFKKELDLIESNSYFQQVIERLL
jgi:adenosine deaminase